MHAGLAEPGVGVSALLLSMATLFMMLEKGSFTVDETYSIIDTALSILQSDSENDKTLPESTVISAQKILENIRRSLSAF